MHRQQFMMKSKPLFVQPRSREGKRTEDNIGKGACSDPRPLVDRSVGSNKQHSFHSSTNDEECYSSSGHHGDKDIRHPDCRARTLQNSHSKSLNQFCNDETHESEGNTSVGSLDGDRRNRSYDQDEEEEQMEGSCYSENEVNSQCSLRESHSSQDVDSDSRCSAVEKVGVSYHSDHSDLGDYPSQASYEEEDDPSYVENRSNGSQEHDYRSSYSGVQEEDQSYNVDDPFEHHSHCSQDDRSSYSGGQEEDRSYNADDPSEQQLYCSHDQDDRSSYSGDHGEDQSNIADEHNSNCSQYQSDRSSYSGDQEEDRSYNADEPYEHPSDCSQDQEDRSSCSGDHGEDRSSVFDEHHSNCSQDQSDRSSYSGIQEEDRSYNADEPYEHPSDCSQDQEDRSSCSGDHEEDRSNVFDEHHSNCSQDQSDRSSYSGIQEEDRSYNADDPPEHESDCSQDCDDRSSYTGYREENLSYIGDDPYEHHSDCSQDQDDRSSYSGGQEGGRSYNADDPYEHHSASGWDQSSWTGDENPEIRSYDSGNLEENRSHSGRSQDYDQSSWSGDQVEDESFSREELARRREEERLRDDGDTSISCKSDAQEEDPSYLSSDHEGCSEANNSSEDDLSFVSDVERNSVDLEEEGNDGEQKKGRQYHSSESMTVIELDEESDTGSEDQAQLSEGSKDSSEHMSNVGKLQQFSDSGHRLKENTFVNGDDGETCNDSSLDDFDSFAYDASVASSRRHSGTRGLRIGEDFECSDEGEDVSVLSSLPANTFATTKVTSLRNEPSALTANKGPNIVANNPQPSAAYASIGIHNPLDESSVASSVASVKSSETGDFGKVASTKRQTHHGSSTQNQQSGHDFDESESSCGGSGSFAGDETLVSQQLIGDASSKILSPMVEQNYYDGSGTVSDDNSKPRSYADDVSVKKSENQSLAEAVGSSLRLTKPIDYGGYSREQIARLVGREQSTDLVRFKRRKDLRGQGKSDSLIEFAANVHGALVNNELTELLDPQNLLSSSRLLLAFEVLTGIFLQLSDELELLQTFANGKVSPAIEMLESILAFSKPLDDIFKKLQPILLHHLTVEIDEELDDFLYGMNLILDLLSELSHRVGEKQLWNARANNAFVTLLELLTRDSLEVSCIYEDVDTPPYEHTDLIHDAWEATGHIEELKTLLASDDLFMFRQICYEVILSTDQWCPNNNILMDICGIENMSNDEQNKSDEDDVLSPPPEAALQILEKITGNPLPRILTMASILRRLLPPQAIADSTISENFARSRNTARRPIGVPPSSLVTITSIPESWNDQDALGVAGVGKTTLAAMVANHNDIRRFYNDGIAWIYVGEIELNYNRYVQCLQDLLSQLEVDDDEEPLFPELLHIPGESAAMRKRREEGFMIYLRETIVEFLRFRNVLIILDDVCFEPDLDWFDFAPAPAEDDEDEDDEGSCAILITSRRRNLLPPADTVEVDMLDDLDGIALLMSESGSLAKVIKADALETKSVVRECACHPLTIKSVGRWLNLKHTTVESLESVEEMEEDVIKSMNRILKGELQNGTDMMYEILNMSLSPTIDGEPTTIIKFCFAAFVRVFCDRKHISDFALADSTPIVPMASTELLFESLLNLEKDALFREGSLFHEQKKEAAKLIPDALASLGVFKVIITYTEAPEDSSQDEVEDEKYLQIMHRIQQEYGEYLYEEDVTLTELTKDGEMVWNKAFAKAFMAKNVEWDAQAPDAGLDYALEMLPSHMMRGGMLAEAGKILRNEKFIRGRLSVLGRENGSRRHIKDCESLFEMLGAKRGKDQKRIDPLGILRSAYEMLGSLLKMGEDEFIEEEGSPEAVEVGRCHYEIGFSLAERRCWEGAIHHWELSQEFLVSSLGMVELVAGLLYNIAVVNTEMHEYDFALGSLKQCLRIRGAIHGEEHILYAQTIQKIGDVFLAMSDYHEAMESYDWALDVMHIEPSHHRISIGDTLEQLGKIHYSKGEIEESLQSYQDALRSKQIDLGEDHPELAQIYHQIGNCLSNLGQTDDAIAHLEEAIRLKSLDPSGGYERDSDVLTIEGILNNLNCKQKEGLECYEKALQILVTKVPHRKEKVAALLHLIGCVYLMSGEHKKALKLFEESLYARRRVLGFVHLDVASTLFNMAFLHQSRNRLDKALKCLEEALKIRQLRLPDSEKVAVTHEKIGNLARGIGKTKKAENAFTEALRIRKFIHGNSHEAVATVLQELGDLMDDLGEYEDAMKQYVEALEIRENRLGPDDLAVAETYYSMGFTLQNNGALDRALQCLEESLSIRKFQLGDDAKDVGDTLNMMGFLQAKRGEHDDALSLLWDALRIRKLQGDNVKVSETLNNIGNVHREKQEYDLSIECYEECLRIRRAELGDEHEKVADALIALGNVQSDLEYNEEAMDSYKEGMWFKTYNLI
jgi:tetratricopeptide (TPR) repeat protein